VFLGYELLLVLLSPWRQKDVKFHEGDIGPKATWLLKQEKVIPYVRATPINAGSETT